MEDRQNIFLSVPPVCEPLDLIEAKAHIVYTDDVDDQLITDMIVGARELVEDATWRRLMVQTVVVSQDQWPGYVIELPVAPIISVTGVTYVDTSGVTQTLSPTIYQVDTRSHIPRIEPVYGSIWPPVQLLTQNAIQVTCVVGYAQKFTTAFSSDPHTLNMASNPWVNGQLLQLYNSGGLLAAGLLPDTNYYVINATANSLQLSLTPAGSAVTLTGDGTGTSYAGVVPRRLRQAMLMSVGLQYNNREAAVIDNRAAEVAVPFGLQSILDRYSLKAW